MKLKKNKRILLEIDFDRFYFNIVNMYNYCKSIDEWG